ncbi:MAG: hypothetical protein ACE366_03825 [Bradymonadia bacterium]
MSEFSDSLISRLNNLQNQYGVYFAGHARITRDIGIMDNLIEQAAGLLSEAKLRMGDADAQSAAKAIDEALNMYRNEREAIAKAQAEGGDDAVEAQMLMQWASFGYHVYRRHFAGHSRSTRDLGLLGETIEDLTRLQGEMGALAEEMEQADQPFANARETLARNLEVYKKERGEIVAARGAGSLEQQSDVLAQVANEQFGLYQAHFAGKPRISRRPGTLQRIIDNLTQIKDRMETLKQQGLRSEANDRNIGIVENRLGFYTKELEEVRQVRQDTRFEDLVGALGAGANAVFEIYSKNFAGQDRGTRDIALMRTLCDELYDIGRQMEEMSRVKDNNQNGHNLMTVTDNLVMYTREYDMILEAQPSK